jgi:membrane-bound lytic murein transglycosylase F
MFLALRSLAGLLFLLALLAGCNRLEPPGPEQPLVVGLPADPVFQQTAPNSEGMNGFSRDLVEAFADTLGVGVRIVVAQDNTELLDLVRTGKVHMAAAVPALGNDPALNYSPPLRETRQLIVQHASALPVDSPEKLAGREIDMLPGAPQAQTLLSLNIDPPPVIVERPGIDELELLSGVARHRHELAASDELHLAIAANFNPDLEVAFELPGKLAYVWAFPNVAENRELRERASRFIESAKQDGTFTRLNDRYFGHIRRMDVQDIETFIENMRNRLPDFRHAFQEAQEITGIDWRLIAALAYQESKWDPLATSPTGVRGIMMLTEDTADRMNVSNRLDAKQSIRAGAKYLALLMDDLPDSIKHPDRLWFALAAYNLGMGHLNGARTFAPGLKRDPDVWYDMKQVLPLMSRPEYYKRLKSGRARGGEAVILVENIRNYFDVLSRFEPVYTPPSLSSVTPRAKTKAKPKRSKKSTRRR